MHISALAWCFSVLIWTAEPIPRLVLDGHWPTPSRLLQYSEWRVVEIRADAFTLDLSSSDYDRLTLNCGRFVLRSSLNRLDHQTGVCRIDESQDRRLLVKPSYGFLSDFWLPTHSEIKEGEWKACVALASIEPPDGFRVNAGDGRVAVRLELLPRSIEQYIFVAEGRIRRAHTPSDRIQVLCGVAKFHLLVGNRVLARSTALELRDLAEELPDSVYFGYALEEAHSVLGQLAAENGRMEDARAHLLAAGAAPAPSKSISLGPKPDMTFAREMAERGEIETVLEYLKLCEQKAKLNPYRLAAIRVSFREGKIVPELEEQCLPIAR